jgi:gamma-glutamyltranspeptidase
MTIELHTAGHRRGVVCAPHRDAVEAGRLVLANGGNALEAMVAMAATAAAIYPHMSHRCDGPCRRGCAPRGRIA